MKEIEASAAAASIKFSRRPGQQRPRQFGKIALLALAAMFAIAASMAAFRRGIWLDEVWSLYLSNPSIAIKSLLRDRWLLDTHPFFTSITYWLTRVDGTDDIRILRIRLNLPALLIFVSGTIILAKEATNNRSFYYLFGILLIGHYESLEYFVDFRNYFWMICTTGIAIEYLFFLSSEKDKDRLYYLNFVDILGFSAIIASVCLHFVSGLLVSAVYFFFVVAFWRSDRQVVASQLAISLGLAWSVMVICAAIQLPQVFEKLDVHWIQTTTLDAFVIFSKAIAKILIPNPPATFFLIVAIFSIFRGRSQFDYFSVTVFFGVLAGAAGIIFLNYLDPIIIDRYLIPCQVMGTAILASLISKKVRTSNALPLVALAAAVFTSIQAFNVSPPNWNAGLDIVKAASRSCPTTKVVVASSWRFTSDRARFAAHREGAVATDGQRRMARNVGVHVDTLDNTTPYTLRAGTKCPTLLWVEHVSFYAPDASAMLAMGKLSLARGHQAKMLKTDTGRVVEIIAETAGTNGTSNE